MYIFRKYLFIFFAFMMLVFSLKAYSITNDEYSKINKLIELENIDKAFQELKVIQQKEPKLSAKAQILIGKLYLSLEQPAKAFSFFDKATFTSVTTDDLAYAGMSLASVKLGNLIDAQKFANKSLKENPDLVDAKLALGLIYSDFGQYDKSEKFFKAALLASGTSLFATRQYASNEMRKGNNKKAKEIINKILLEKKADAATIDLLGKLHWLEGNIKESVRLRTEASVMFRKAGNITRSEQIVNWLNTSATPKVNQIIEENSKPTVKEVITKEKPSIKKILQPNDKPEPIKIDAKQDVFTGSGVVLNNGKWIITNRHVVKGAKYISVRNGLGKVRIVKSVQYPSNDKIDLALLILSKPYPSNYSIKFNEISLPKTGQKIFVMGYPISSILGRFNPSITEGIISKNRGFGELTGEFQITAPMNKGNSGGPIFNANGEIVGISVAGLDKVTIMKEEGFIPQDVNLGISSEVLKTFLNQPTKASISNKKGSFDASQIYQFMRPSVVIVVCQ